MGGGAGGGAALAEVMLGWIGSQPMGMAYAKARKTGGGWAGGSEVGGESGDEGESGDAGSGTLRTSGFTCGSVCVVCIGGGGAAAERRRRQPTNTESHALGHTSREQRFEGAHGC